MQIFIQTLFVILGAATMLFGAIIVYAAVNTIPNTQNSTPNFTHGTVHHDPEKRYGMWSDTTMMKNEQPIRFTPEVK